MAESRQSDPEMYRRKVWQMPKHRCSMRFVGETDRNGFPVLRQPEACNFVRVKHTVVCGRFRCFEGVPVVEMFASSTCPSLVSIHVQCEHAPEGEHMHLPLHCSFGSYHVVLLSGRIALSILV